MDVVFCFLSFIFDGYSVLCLFFFDGYCVFVSFLSFLMDIVLYCVFCLLVCV